MDLGPLAPIDNVEMYSALMGMLRISVTSETVAAGLSILSCPTFHADTVPVELAVTGERVAVLCLDCDRQLPAGWRTMVQEVEDSERGHRETHHGHREVFPLACHPCAQELGNAS